MKKLTLFLSLAVVLSFAVVAKAQAPMSYRVDTINDLIGITLYGSDAKAIAYVGGGTTRNDGLGGLFFYDGTSSQTTNTYAVYKPTSVTTGRWFKLPTSVVNQQTDVTVATESTYAWKLLDGNAANAFSIGLTSANVYLQTWGSRPLYINSSLGGNNTIINLTGGSVGIGTASPEYQLNLAKATGVQSDLGIKSGASSFVFGSQDVGSGRSAIAHGNDDGGAGNIISIGFGTITAGVPANPVLSLNQIGNVGIGTTAPVSSTEIQGGLTTAGSILTLGTKEPSVVVSDVLGRVNFYAPLDAAGTDANLVAGSIVAQAEGTFSATSNATSLLFQTGSSEVATTKLSISSAGAVAIPAPGTFALGGGTAIAKILTANAQIDFPQLSANGTTNMTLAVTGATTNSVVTVSVTDGVGTDGIILSGFVSAADTVTIRAANPTLNAIDPGAAVSYRAVVINY